jgi:homoserine kinase
LRVTARVPATVANLGPGFDCFGLALALHNDMVIDTDAEPGVTIEGEGADELPRDESNLVLRALRAGEAEAKNELPPFRLECTNRIPLERGLGSSAAAIVGALVIANHVFDSWIRYDRLLKIAVDLEGHGDNIGAALLGGTTMTYEAHGRWWVDRLEPPAEIKPVALIPESVRIQTEAARHALPGQVSFADATFNAIRAAMLGLAFTTRPSLLYTALEDRLHQDRRLELAPASRELFDRLRGQEIPVCVAGSGPTLLAFDTDQGGEVPDPGPGWVVLRPGIDLRGAHVLEGDLLRR